MISKITKCNVSENEYYDVTQNHEISVLYNVLYLNLFLKHGVDNPQLKSVQSKQ